MRWQCKKCEVWNDNKEYLCDVCGYKEIKPPIERKVIYPKTYDEKIKSESLPDFKIQNLKSFFALIISWFKSVLLFFQNFINNNKSKSIKGTKDKTLKKEIKTKSKLKGTLISKRKKK